MSRYNSYIICLESRVVYRGVREAGRVLGIDHSNISKNCQGKRPSAGGYHFQYFDPCTHFKYKYYDPSVL